MPRIFILLAFVFSSALHAQESLVTIRAMSMDRGNFPETFVLTKEGYEAINFSDVQPSAPYRAIVGKTLPVFYSEPSKEDGEKPKPDAILKLPRTTGGVLLLGWQEGEKRNFAALPDNLDKGGRENWLLVNATTETLAFQLGKETTPTVVQPGKSVTHRVTVPFDAGAAVTTVSMKEGESKVIFSTYWTVYKEQRCVIIFVKEGERFRVRQILDVTSIAKKEE